MVQNRTIQFIGYAYGSSPVTLTAEINGNTVFSGEVPTIDSPLPPMANVVASAGPLFLVENSSLFSTDFSGQYPMTISVSSGNSVILGEVLSNYMHITNDARYGNATTFLNISTNTEYRDPRTDVVIDGTPQSPDRPPGCDGAWPWVVNNPGTIDFNLQVGLGNCGNIS
jgi:hypothetical protein